MKRTAVIITIITAVLTVVYNLKQLNVTSGKTVRAASASPPVLEAPPLLQFSKPDKTAIGTLEVWNLKPFQMPNLKDMFKPFYTLNKNGRFESLLRSDRPNDRWEFQGILLRDNAPRALFYNSGQKKLKSLGSGEQLDDGLKIRSIGSGSVTLEATGDKKLDKKPQVFELRIFNANKEQYAIKKKSS